jgi:hypothetical protein
MKELDGVQGSASVCGRFNPEEISPASQREAEKDENPELTALKKKRNSIPPEVEPGFPGFRGCRVVTIPTEI